MLKIFLKKSFFILVATKKGKEKEVQINWKLKLYIDTRSELLSILIMYGTAFSVNIIPLMNNALHFFFVSLAIEASPKIPENRA